MSEDKKLLIPADLAGRILGYIAGQPTSVRVSDVLELFQEIQAMKPADGHEGKLVITIKLGEKVLNYILSQPSTVPASVVVGLVTEIQRLDLFEDAADPESEDATAPSVPASNDDSATDDD